MPVKVFSSVDEMSRWIIGQQRVDGKLTAPQLVEATEILKRDFRAGTLRVNG